MGTVKYSGPVASFHCPTEATIRSLKVYFSPKQEGSGDPSPENVRPIEGWDGVEVYHDDKTVVWNQWLKPYDSTNWVPYSTHTNVTFSNGIATSEWVDTNTGYAASIRNSTGTLQSEGQIWYASYMVKSDKNYGFGIEFCGGRQHRSVVFTETNEWYHVSAVDSYYRGTRNYTYVANCSSSPTDDIIGMIVYSKSPLLINLTQMFGAGNEPTKEEFESQCALNGIDLTEYHDYSEGVEIPWKTNNTETYQVEFGVLGKNKLDVNSYTQLHSASLNNNYLTNTNTDTRDNFQLSVDGYNGSTRLGQLFGQINMPNGAYSNTFVLSNTYENMNVIYIKHNGITRDIGIRIPVDLIVGQTYTISMDVTGNDPTTVGGLSFGNIQLELGSTATAYESYDPNKTVYGGWVDLVSGEVQQEWYKMDLTELTWNVPSVSDRSVYSTNLPFARDQSISNGNIICSHYVTAHQYTSISVVDDFTIKGHANALYPSVLYIRDTRYSDLSSFRANISGIVCYKLAEPITYSLAPTEMQTFLAQNNVWSNADYVEVEYDLHETQNILARKQFIIANQPHIVKPAAAPLQNFVTDVPAPLKECKVYFSPVQEGSGDPSPENVRPIIGWDGVEVYRMGKNLFDKDAVINNSWIRAGNLSEENPLGAIRENTSGYTLSSYIPVYPNTTYTIKYNITSLATAAGMVFFSEQDANSAISGISLYYQTYINSSTTREYYTFTTPTNCYYIRISIPPNASEVQLELGSTTTDYEPYNGTAIPITFPTEAGTIYGGYVDLVTGEVWAEYAGIDAVWSAGTNATAVGTTIIRKRFPLSYTPLTGTAHNICNCVKYMSSTGESAHFSVSASGTAGYAYVYLPNETLDNQQIQVVSKLQSPQLVTTLTPTQLKTLRGTNNIWSNSNGDITVQFWRH